MTGSKMVSFSTKLYELICVCVSKSLFKSGLTDLLKWSFLLREEVVFHNLSCCLSMDSEIRSVPDTN